MISTSIHINSLTIGHGNEFFVFMKLWARHKWASFQMTPLKWVEAMNLFNAELESVNRLHNCSMTLKNPHTLVAMLGTIKVTVAYQLAMGNFKCGSAPIPLQSHFSLTWPPLSFFPFISTHFP